MSMAQPTDGGGTAANFMRPETMLSTTVAGLLIAQFTDSLTNIPAVAAACHPFVLGLVFSFAIALAIVFQAERVTGMTLVYWLVGGISLFNAATGSFAVKQSVLPSQPAPIAASAPAPSASSKAWFEFATTARADEIADPAQKPWFPPPTPQAGDE